MFSLTVISIAVFGLLHRSDSVLGFGVSETVIFMPDSREFLCKLRKKNLKCTQKV